MAQADGTVVIDTRIDDDGIQKGTKNIENGLSKVGKGADSAGSKLKNGLGNLAKAGAKIGLAAITAVSTGIIALTKQAVESFAEYEQLVGGVETLFKDSADQVMQYANNAYKTAGLSANEYMETVTSFSASLIQSLGGSTQFAASVADMAITDMADNANKMGTDIEMIQNAYQGFAKQNYTMLDNLKLGYGGTKKEMERLLRDAEALQGYGEHYYDVSNFADIADAIHVIQTNMEISGLSYQEAMDRVASGELTLEQATAMMGTTAKEAAITIQGSAASMKAAWQNMLVGLADENANFDALVSNLVNSVLVFSDNLMPRIQQSLAGIGKLVEGLAPIIGEKLPQLIASLLPSLLSAATSLISSLIAALPELLGTLNQVIPMAIDSILSALPLLTEAALQIVVALVNGISANAPLLISSALSAVEQISMTLLENLPLLIEAGLQLLMALAQGIVDAIPQLTAMLPQIIEQTVSTLMSLLPLILSTGTEILVSLILGIIDAIPQLVTMLPTIIDTICTVLIDNIDLIISAGFQLIVGLIGGIQDCIPRLIAMLPQIIAAIVQTLLSLGTKVWQAGVQLLESFIKGIVSMVSKLNAKAREVGQKLLTVFKELPGKIISVGKNLVEGIWKGISSSYTWIKNKISGWVGDVLGFIKRLFGIHSPSTKTAWMGKMMSYGLAEGILSGASRALSAIDTLGNQMTGRLSGINVGTPALAGFHVPHLASGAVIPPRSEFMAVLGDQKSGMNIETPERLLRDLFRQEFASAMGGAGGRTYQFIAQIDGTTVFNKMISEAQLRRTSSGRNPFEL